MELITRLDILKDAEQISENTYNQILTVIKYFKETMDVSLTEENSSMFITHIAIAFTRMEKKETIDPLEDVILRQLVTHNCFGPCQELIRALEEQIGMSIPEYEKGYIMIHLCTLFEKEGI